MKKLFILISILLLATSLYAVDSLKVELDLTKNPIFLCGITNNASPVTTEGFTYDQAKNLSTQSINSLVISSAEGNPDDTVKGSFYIWWYVYSPEAYTISIWFENFKGASETENNIIPFHITTAGIDKIESLENANTASKTIFKELPITNKLVKNHQEVIVPSFNLTGYNIDKYSTDIHIEIIANT